MSQFYDLSPTRAQTCGCGSVGALLQLSEREEKLIRLIREMQFGEIQLHIADGQPVRLEEIRRSVKL